MRILAIDVGSSSIKAGYFKNGRLKDFAHIPVMSVLQSSKVEVPATGLLEAFEKAICQAMTSHKKLDAIALDTFSPGLVALDKQGQPIVGCITHQDRRSMQQACELETRVGAERHLNITGNRPFPGGMASTSLLWIKQREPGRFKQIARIGQPTTLLVHHLTGKWTIDPSQAAFLGLYESISLAGWSAELCQAVGIKMAQLPEILFADEVAGRTLTPISERLGIPADTPVFASLVDTSAAMVATSAQPGTLVHSAGSSDVLALCLKTPKPAPDILTRPLGPGKYMPRRWLAVSTIAAGGSTMKWLHENMFRDLSAKAFAKLTVRIGRQLVPTTPNTAPIADAAPMAPVSFQPYLAGDRTSMENRAAAFKNLTLATDRCAMLQAAIVALAQTSQERLERLAKIHSICNPIYTMGGQTELAAIMQRYWPGGWKFQPLEHEALGGLVKMVASLETRAFG